MNEVLTYVASSVSAEASACFAALPEAVVGVNTLKCNFTHEIYKKTSIHSA